MTQAQTPYRAGYALLRLTVGTNFLLHGAVRLGKLPEFRAWMTELFADSILPGGWVAGWATILPFLEFIFGLLLIVGLFTFPIALASGALVLVLLTGSCLIENWDAVGIQMIYALALYVLIARSNDNAFAFDTLRAKRIT